MVLKIVCDTNVLVSGFLWRGNAHELLQAIGEKKAVLFTSPNLLTEFARVLTYERLQPFVSNAPEVLKSFEKLAVFVKPVDSVCVIKEDPADDRVLECALAAEADYIVSGDWHLLKLKRFNKTKIVTVKTMLGLI